MHLNDKEKSIKPTIRTLIVRSHYNGVLKLIVGVERYLGEPSTRYWRDVIIGNQLVLKTIVSLKAFRVRVSVSPPKPLDV